MDASAKARSERAALALLTFLLLAFPLSWYPWILALLAHRTSGPNPLGVLLAGLIASAVWRGWRGTRDLLLAIIRVRAPLASWAGALLTGPAALGVALAIARARGMAIHWMAPPAELADRFVFTLLFVALGEEPGWRGTLLPLLQQIVHPLLAASIVAIVWAVWHLPLMGTEFAWPIVPAFAASVFGGAFVLAWLYNASGGSVLLPMLLHAILNTVGAGYAFHLVDAGELPSLWAIYGAVWLAFGVLVVILTRGRLGCAKAAAEA